MNFIMVDDASPTPHIADQPRIGPESNSTDNGTISNGGENNIKSTKNHQQPDQPDKTMNGDVPNNDTTTAPPRAKIAISLKKKKTNKSKSSPKQQQLITNNSKSLLVDEYSTIAEEAEIISQRRKEEGNILVIPCKQYGSADGGANIDNEGERKEKRKQPLLAGRLALLKKDNDGVVDANATSTAAVDKDNTKNGSTTDAMEDEAVQQLIQSAEQKDTAGTDIAGSTSHGRGLVIAAPSQNKLTTRTDAATATTTTATNNNTDRHNDRVMNDEEVFQHELAHHAPDVDPTSNVYANVSIGDFGSALLRGMGWTGGSSTSNKGGEELVVKPRPHRLGLGAKPLPLPSSSSSSTKPGGGIHRRARRPEDVKRDEERLRQQEEAERQLEEKKKLDVQYTLQKGSVVTVRDDSQEDERRQRQTKRRAKVIQTAGVPGLNRILIQYEGEEKEVSITKSSVALCSWDELDKYPFKQIPLVKEQKKEKNNEMKQQQSSPRKMDPRESDGYDDSGKDRRRKRDRSYSYDDDDYSRDDERRRRRKDDDRRRDHRSSHKYYSDDSRDDDSYERRRSKKHKRKKRDHRSRSRSDSRERERRRTRHKDSSRRRDRSRSYSPEDSDRRKRSKHHHSSQSSPHNNNHHNQQHLHWLIPNIRVRLISNKIPKYYLQKGIVQDVIQSSSSSSGPKAVLLMDNGQVLDKVPERYLETALPKTGGHVIILEESKDNNTSSQHHWKKGRLLERSSQDGYGIIQLEEDLEVIKVSLDGIAEWCGDMDMNS